ncbi:MAG: EpsG family protein [Ginsengibacter sp.]
MLIYYIYFICLSVLAVEYELNPFKSKGLLIFIGISLALMAGLRGDQVSRDYLLYQYAFDNIRDFIPDEAGGYFSVYEPGFIGVVILLKFFFIHNYGVAIMLFFACASVAMKIFVFDRFSINPYLIILLYFSHYFFLHEMTQIRIGFAAAIFLISLIFYFKNNYKTFVGLILMATMFHYSALVYLIVLFIKKENFNWYIYSFLLIISFVLGFMKFPLFTLVGNLFSISGNSGKIANYSKLIEYGLSDDVKVFNIINLTKICCSIYLMYLVPKHEFLKDQKLIFFLKCNIISIFTLSLFSGVPLVAFRLSDLFSVVTVFNFAYLAKYLPFLRFNIWFVILIAGILFYSNIIYGGLLGPYEILKLK